MSRVESTRPLLAHRPACHTMGMDALLDFHDRTVVVTGAASGIGLELAKVFAEQGMNVVRSLTTEDMVNDVVIERVSE